MKSPLPKTGTPALLSCLSPYVPDEFINGLWPWGPTGGRRQSFSAAQLWRTHLLALLTPVHSLNLLTELLPGQRPWRQFAHLRHHGPDVRMLNHFRARAGVLGLRQINAHLLEPLLAAAQGQATSIAILDATDLPASCLGFKKRRPAPTVPPVPRPVTARANRARATGLSVTRNTPCACGFPVTAPGCC